MVRVQRTYRGRGIRRGYLVQSNDIGISMQVVNVQDVPRTPPLNKFGGAFENGWEYFFSDLDNHLQQMQSVYQSGDVYVNRNGMVVTATGTAKREKTFMGVRPVVPFTQNGVIVDSDGYVSAEADTAFSVTFIARG